MIRNQVCSTLQVYFGDDQLPFICDFNSITKKTKEEIAMLGNFNNATKSAYLELILLFYFFFFSFFSFNSRKYFMLLFIFRRKKDTEAIRKTRILI